MGAHLTSMPDTAAQLNLDNAWEPGAFQLRAIDALSHGPHLRYHATRKGIERFYNDIVTQLPSRILYGSGDFHHLSAVLARRCAQDSLRPIHIVSFDNHPDWDIRPPRWACGGWINRALETPNIAAASVWGCGNFELAFPARLFRNRKALTSGRLKVHAWAERQSIAVQRQFNCMTRVNWRDRFETAANNLTGQPVYVTVDLDCLADDEIVTNWENGLFRADDVAWAIRLLKTKANLVAADVCGSRTEPVYARRFQRFAGNWDHPKLASIALEEIRQRNRPAIQTIWDVLGD